MKIPRWLRATIPPTIVVILLLLSWESWVRLQNVKPYVLPAPSRVWAAFWRVRPQLGHHLGITLAETSLGIVLGAAVGFVVAVAIASSSWLRRAIEPLLLASQTIPLIVLAPLLVLWFGFGLTPKVLVVVIIVFFPVSVATSAAMLATDADQIDLVRSLGATRFQVLRHVKLPSALPAFFAGLRISATYAVAGAVYGEVIGGDGLGRFIEGSRRNSKVDQVLVGVILIALLSAALLGLVQIFSRIATPWTYLRNDNESLN